MSRLLAAVLAATSGLTFWWALTEPLPVPPPIHLGVAALVLACAGIVAGRSGALAAPVALLFSLFLGSIFATQLHQVYRPGFTPVSDFAGIVTLRVPGVLIPLAGAVVVGALAGLVGERLLPSSKRN